jgi:protein Mpv17
MGRWNKFLEIRFPLRSVGNSNHVSFKALAKRVAADQIIMYVIAR